MEIFKKPKSSNAGVVQAKIWNFIEYKEHFSMMLLYINIPIFFPSFSFNLIL